MIRRALASAGLAPSDVDAVEAHGTGTALGDPIEADALIATFGQDRPADRPLWLGSLKSNIGHAQAAAGVGGVIKMVMAMRHGVLPKTLHIDTPTSHVDWSSGAVSLLTEPRPWMPNGHPRRAGVSSFGISGTNAHLILEDSPTPPEQPELPPPLEPALAEPALAEPALAEPPPARPGAPAALPWVLSARTEAALPWVLSARTEAALREQAARLRAHLEADRDLYATDIGHTLATGRASFDHRAVIVGRTGGELLSGLDALASRASDPGLVTGRVSGGKLAFLFTGQGSQHPGMGRELYDAYPVFAAALDEACEQLDLLLDRPLHRIMFGDLTGLLDRTRYAQAALFALEVALYRLVDSCGVYPDYLAGHSVGEVAAAHVAGVLSLPDAAALVTARGALMQAARDDGLMVAIQATGDELSRSLDGLADRAGIAALNGPSSTVISGDPDVVTAVAAHWAGQGRQTRRLHVSHAFHSPHMAEVLDRFRDAIGGLTFHPPRIPVVSNVTGRVAEPQQLTDPGYWAEHIRRPVRFTDTVATLEAGGVTSYLELGPGGVLTALTAECLTDAGPASPVLAATLRRGQPEPHTTLTALARLHAGGRSVDWTAMLAERGGHTELPTYPFQRQRCWIEPPAARDIGAAGLDSAGHPLLGAAIELPDGNGHVFTGRICLASHPWLADHVILDSVILPGAALVELALHAADRVGSSQVEELTLHAPLAIATGGRVQLQVTVGPLGGDGRDEHDGRRPVTIRSRPAPGRAADDTAWTVHASGWLSQLPLPDPRAAEAARTAAGGAWPPAGAMPVDLTGLYQRLADQGYRYGPAFQGLRGMWLDGDTVYAEVRLPEAEHPRAGHFALHPALLDAALHAMLPGVQPPGAPPEGGTGLLLPFAWDGVGLQAVRATALRVRLSPAGEHAMALDITDLDGGPVASVASLRMRPLPATGFATAGSGTGAGAGAGSLYHLDWTPAPAAITGSLSAAPLADTPAADTPAAETPAADTPAAETPAADTPAAAPMAGSRCAVLGVDADLVAALVGHGAEASMYPDLDALSEAVGAGAPAPDVVFGSFRRDEGDPSGGPVAAARDVTGRALRLLQDWLGNADLTASRLVLLTRQAMVARADDRAVPPGHAALWGLVRAAQAEHPDRFTLLDIDDRPASYAALGAAVTTGEAQLAVRDGAILLPRLARVGPAEALPVPAGDPAWRVDVPERGSLNNLTVVPNEVATRPLEPGEVRICVRAAGVNFRDVALALGMVPEHSLMGLEGAGTVVEVGPGVTRFRPGDRVMGLFPAAFGPLAVADQRTVAPMPETWSYPQAASVPVVFLTAFYGLADLAGIRPGESLLVHAAAGGVGMAAVQLARHWAWRSSAPPAPASGTCCAARGSTRGTWHRHARWTSSGGSPRQPGAAAWTWCWTASPTSSWTRRCGCCPAVAGSSRWARPTSATLSVSPLNIPAWRTRRSTCSQSTRTGSGRCSPSCCACSSAVPSARCR